MGKKGKNTKSATAPLSRLEPEGIKREGKGKEEGKIKEKERRGVGGAPLCCPAPLKEKGIEIGRRSSFNKLFLPNKIG